LSFSEQKFSVFYRVSISFSCFRLVFIYFRKNIFLYKIRGRPSINEVRTKLRKIDDPSFLVCIISALLQSPLSMRTQHKFQKNPKFFHQKCGRPQLKNCPYPKNVHTMDKPPNCERLLWGVPNKQCIINTSNAAGIKYTMEQKTTKAYYFAETKISQGM